MLLRAWSSCLYMLPRTDTPKPLWATLSLWLTILFVTFLKNILLAFPLLQLKTIAFRRPTSLLEPLLRSWSQPAAYVAFPASAIQPSPAASPSPSVWCIPVLCVVAGPCWTLSSPVSIFLYWAAQTWAIYFVQFSSELQNSSFLGGLGI